jgi:hypothetical protein
VAVALFSAFSEALSVLTTRRRLRGRFFQDDSVKGFPFLDSNRTELFGVEDFRKLFVRSIVRAQDLQLLAGTKITQCFGRFE